MSRIDALENMLATGTDNTLLRFGLGREYLAADDPHAAAVHLRACVELDPTYSAAWKMLGKAYQASGAIADAEQAWEDGIRAAQEKGDKQAEKEMTVFLRRIRKARQ